MVVNMMEGRMDIDVRKLGAPYNNNSHPSPIPYHPYPHSDPHPQSVLRLRRKRVTGNG